MSHSRVYLLLIITLLTACGGFLPNDLPAPQALSAGSPAATDVQLPLSPTPSSAATATPDLYAGLRIQELAAREYGDGNLQTLQQLSTNSSFNRYLISYPSDGIIINGFVDVPTGEGPHPVILLLHGYIDPAVYKIETYTAGYAAEFARAGFLVIHPNYRNYPPSDSGPNLFRVGYALDVLNLIAILHSEAGKPGILETADAANIFLWGHSMGGGIAQRVLTVGAPINGAVLYGSMSGDERQNFEHIRDVLSEGQRGIEELDVPEEALREISSAYFYKRIAVPVSIHHGDIDAVVPLQWSVDLCQRLLDLGKDVECFTYHNMPHTFYGDNDNLLIQRSIEFFLRNLK
ncbi:MAG: alpha/beta fold hydrolase [Chloroflexi bacterium]|nr:alpha/beta fold hydrolase [Chloroflexota bacterium]MQC26148.1 alpha/beta fold hydrolase [Chloroflexota bacterium]